MFAAEDTTPVVRGRGKRKIAGVEEAELTVRREATTLERVHAAMLLQAGKSMRSKVLPGAREELEYVIFETESL